MLWRDRSIRLLFFCFLFSVITKSPTTAQITPDNTLGAENSVVTENVTVNNAVADLIKGGAIRDNNLFHSFSEFNVGNGAANLFLLNPNGIVFGENAALDVNGSFVATTADSYIFDNGFEYSWLS